MRLRLLAALLLGSRLLAADCPGIWSQPASGGPGGRYSFAMAHDAASGRTLLFGGTNDANRDLGDTWAWDGASWASVATTGPAPRKTAAMVYDEARRRPVLFGGSVFSGGVNRYFPETWEWTGTAWETRAQTGPSGRCCMAMAYDSERRRVVLFGGDVNGVAQGDTWEWDGTSWTRMTVTSGQPSARHSHAMAYDPARGRVVLFGGMTASGLSAETWEWDGASWTRRDVSGPNARVRAALAWDGGLGALVLTGGEAPPDLADTTVWRLDSSGYRALEAAPYSRRSGHGLAYDARRQRLVTFGGSTAGAHATDTWERQAPSDQERLVPIVLDVVAGTARFTTELVLTNRAPQSVDVALEYTSALGAGSGTVTDRLSPGEQRVLPDTLAYLRGKGLAIPPSSAGQQGGTLRATFSCAAGADTVAATARTTSETQAPLPVGSAGLAYPGLPPESGSAVPLVVDGLRTTAQDRSNVAVYNASASPVTLRLTAVSGERDGRRVSLGDAVSLAPRQWTQVAFADSGLTSGWVLVERVAGSGLFGAYGVVNDNVTNDGSFVASAPAAPGTAAVLHVPVLVETALFRSELVLTNRGAVPEPVRLRYVESLAPGVAPAPVDLTLEAGEQRILPDALDALRRAGAGVGPAGPAYAGALRIELLGPGPHQVSAGARTSSASAGGGRFGLFTPGVPAGAAASDRAVLYGLRRDATNRSNVALVATGEASDGTVELQLQAYDGRAGGRPAGAPRSQRLAPGAWAQLDDFLGSAGVESGWVEVVRTSGTAPWIAYGVVNDGAIPGERTGDGAFVPMRVPPAAPGVTKLIRVAGAYDVAVALADNTCGSGVVVQPQPTSVAHEPGATSFTLTHGSLVFQGHLAADGTFTTDPLPLTDRDSTLAVRIDGTFSTTGLAAIVTVDVRRSSSTCGYHVRWTGTKAGAPNVVP